MPAKTKTTTVKDKPLFKSSLIAVHPKVASKITPIEGDIEANNGKITQELNKKVLRNKSGFFFYFIVFLFFYLLCSKLPKDEVYGC